MAKLFDIRYTVTETNDGTAWAVVAEDHTDCGDHIPATVVARTVVDKVRNGRHIDEFLAKGYGAQDLRPFVQRYMQRIAPPKFASKGDYLKEGADTCPNCGGSDIDGHGVDVLNKRALQECTCHECGASWGVEFELVGYVNLTLDDSAGRHRR